MQSIIMESFGLNGQVEYIEMNLDSTDASTAGADNWLVSNVTTQNVLLKLSWPKFYMTSKEYDVVGLKVLEASIPYVFDTLTGNATFSILEPTDPPLRNFSILPGQYTGTTLAAAIETAINTQLTGYTVTWAPSSYRFVISKGVTIFTLLFDANSTLPSYLGFYPGSSNSAVGNLISTQAAAPTGPFYLYLLSRSIGAITNSDTPDGSRYGGNGSQICMIPINVNPGAVIFYKDAGDFLLTRSPKVFGLQGWNSV